MKLEKRKCKNPKCSAKFSVSINSKQEYCSTICEEDCGGRMHPANRSARVKAMEKNSDPEKI